MPDQTPAPVPTPGVSGTLPGGEGQDEIIKRLVAGAAHPHSVIPAPPAPTPRPAPMMQGPATTHSEGNQLFFHNLGALIGNAAQEHKANQTRKAIGDIQTLNSAWQDAQEHADGDPAKAKELFAAMPQVKAMLSDPKKIKELGKLLAFDPMNPEKNKTVYHDAVTHVDKANKIQKAMEAIKHVLGLHKDMVSKGTPKSEEEIAGMVADRARTGTPDIKGATELVTAQAHLKTAEADLEKAQATARDKYQIGPDKDGQLVAINKSDPTDVVRVATPDGKPVTGATKAGAAPKVAMVENVPYGVARDGKVVTPDAKEWTANDATIFNAAKGAAAQGEANKLKLAQQRETFFSSLPQAVLYKTDDAAKGVKAGELAFVPRKEAAANPAKYAPVGAGDKALGTKARFGEIQVAVDGTNKAIEDLPDTGFDAKARADLAYVMRSPNPNSALDAFLKGEAAKTLTTQQVEYVQWLASLSESAQAMVSLQGLGARSSDRMRGAVAAMLPGASTPSRAYAKGQMKKFQAELTALTKGVPGLGALDKRADGSTSGATTPGATHRYIPGQGITPVGGR